MRRIGYQDSARRGFSLVELIVAVAVLGVIAAAAMPSMADFLERRRVIAAANELAGIIAYARSESNAIGDKVSLHLEKDPQGLVSCAAVSTQVGADRCQCYRPANVICTPGASKLLRHYVLPKSNGVEFTASALSWDTMNYRVTFQRSQQWMNGEKGVSIMVAGRRTGAKLKVEVSDLRLAKLCSPDGTIGGYPVCQ